MSAINADAIAIVQAIQRVKRDGERLRVFANGDSQASSDVASTSVVGTFQTAMVWAWNELPDGVYIILATGSLIMGHSASGVAELVVECDEADTQPTAHGITLTTARVLREMRTFLFLDVAVANGLGATFRVKFNNTNTGTLQAVNPAIQAVAILVG